MWKIGRWKTVLLFYKVFGEVSNCFLTTGNKVVMQNAIIKHSNMVHVRMNFSISVIILAVRSVATALNTHSA